MDALQTLISESLLKFSLFSELSSDPVALKELASLVNLETFQGRAVIIDEKNSDNRMFLLLSGQVVINKINENGQIVVLAKMDARDRPFFGESILLGKFKKSANVVAHSQCECLSLSAANFDKFMQAHPKVAASVFKTMASVLFDRVAKADKDVFIASLMLKK